MTDITRILNEIDTGNASAANQLLPLVYDELRRVAAQKMAQEAPGHTLTATALVHEAYLRIVGSDVDRSWRGRSHFFVSAAEAMRRILVDNARRKNTVKRGGNARRQGIEECCVAAPEVSEDVLAVNEALTKLAKIDRQLADIVKLRCFAGLTIPESAEVLGIGSRSADRLWAYARSWLFEEIQNQ